MKKNSKTISKSEKSKPVTKSEVKQMIASSVANLLKYVDTELVLNSFGNANPTQLYAGTLPTIGTGATYMNGTSIDLESMDLTIQFQDSAGFLSDGYTIRVTIVQACGEGAVVLGDLYQVSSNARASVASPLKYDTEGKLFKTLYDDCFWVDTYNSQKIIKRKLKPRVKRLRYDSVGTAWSTGQTYFNVVAYSPNTQTDLNGIIWARLWFRDV
jgi:hypothetical protein